MVSYSPRVVRFSLDLDVEQKNFLRMYASKNQISASILLRAMIYTLETDLQFSNRILDLIFLAPEVEVDELDDGDTEDEELINIDTDDDKDVDN